MISTAPESLARLINLSLKDLTLDFQPIVDLDSCRVVSAEALLRWNHPKFGRLLPRAFLQQLISSGSIIHLTPWIFRTAFRALYAWHEAGNRDLTLSVNLSLFELANCDVVDIALRALSETRLQSKFIEIEISEQGKLLDDKQAKRNMHSFREAGFGIAVDDFGVDAASLRYLVDVPASTVKIDGSFMEGLPSARHALILKQITRLIEDLGMRVVIEGVSVPGHLQFAVLNRLRYIQGRYLAPPRAASAVLHWPYTDEAVAFYDWHARGATTNRLIS